MEPGKELLDGSPVTAGKDFDAAIGQVVGVAGEPQAVRFCLGISAKGDALHLTGDLSLHADFVHGK